MTREEAAEFTRKLVARAETIVFPKTPKTINNIPVFYFEAVLSALRGPEWVRTEDRLPEGDEYDEILGLYKGTDYLLYDIVQIGWLRLHPEMYVYWIHLPQKPEVEG